MLRFYGRRTYSSCIPGICKQNRNVRAGGDIELTASWKSWYHGLQSVWSQSTIQYPWMCGDPLTNAHRSGRLTVTPLISTGMFIHASVALHPLGIFRSTPQYSRFPYARHSQAGHTTSQDTPCGTRSSNGFSHKSLSRLIFSLCCSDFSLSVTREDLSHDVRYAVDSRLMNFVSESEREIRIVSSRSNAIVKQMAGPRPILVDVLARKGTSER